MLTTCASAASISKPQVIQQLGDDPSCGMPVECYAQAMEALKEAEQKIETLNNAVLTLNKTLRQVATKQSQIKANQTQVNVELEAEQTEMSKNIETLKTTTTNNYKKLYSRRVYSCNCIFTTNEKGGCAPNKVSRGFGQPNLRIQTPASSNGNFCCDICLTHPKSIRKSKMRFKSTDPAKDLL